MLRAFAISALLASAVASSAHARHQVVRRARPQAAARRTVVVRPMAQQNNPARAGVRGIERAQTETNGAIAVLRGKIGELNHEIARLEGENGRKVARALQLRNDIEARKREIERNHRTNTVLALFGALYGRPAFTAVGLINQIGDDARIRQLNQELTQIEADRNLLQQKISAHAARKLALERDLGHLQQAESHLASELATLAAASGSAPVTLKEAKARLQKSRALVTNLNGQVTILRTIRASASDVGVSLDAHILRLEAEAQKAEKLARESTKAALEYVRMALSAEPEVAAQKWLDQKLRQKTQQLLSELGLNPADHVRRLAAQLIPDSAPGAAVLRQQFVAMILQPQPS